MTKEEWLVEFERLNGRAATPNEIAQVWPPAQAAGATTASPAKKTRWWVWTLAAVGLLAVAAGAWAIWSQKSQLSPDLTNEIVIQHIDGAWASTDFADWLRDSEEFKDLDVSDKEDLGEALIDAYDFKMEVKDDKVTFVLQQDITSLLETYKDKLKDTFGISEEQAEEYMDEFDRSMVNAMKGEFRDSDVDYDEDEGLLTVRLFESDIDVKDQTMNITDVNDDLTIAGWLPFTVTKDTKMHYDKDGDTITLRVKGEEYSFEPYKRDIHAKGDAI